MSDDRELDGDLDLRSAFRAVKDSYDGASPTADLTLQRALFASRRNAKKRRLTQWVLVPVAAALFASTAWAGATGRLAPVVDTVREVLHAEASPVVVAPAASSVATNAPAITAPSPPPTQPPSEPSNAAPIADEPAPTRVVATAVAAAPAPAPPPLAATPAQDRALQPATGSVEPRAHVRPAITTTSSASHDVHASAPAAIAPAPRADDPDAQLFEDAHRIHFLERDPARALAAWDRYLAAAPNGSLAPEARYNRALALIRLDRTAEARAVLEEFARGSYRSAEARALLDALARDAGARP
ncbi:MAG: tetratricopeptide repeat protein [Labilithrix sp.]